MFSKFNEESKKVLLNMKKEMLDLKHPYIGSEHLLLSILKHGNSNIVTSLNEEGVTYDNFKDKLVKLVGIGSSSNEFFLYTPLLRKILEMATLNSSDNGKNVVDTYDLLYSLLEEGEGIAIRLLINMGIDIDKLHDNFNTKRKTATSKLLVESFGVNLNEKSKFGDIDPVIGREKEISRLIEVLSRRTKNNPLLLGDAGVGKTAIVGELARRLNSGFLGGLSNKKIISVSMSSLVAGTKYRGEFEERVEKIISELENNDEIILFIDEIHTLVGAGGAEGAIDASNILKPALARGKIKIIGATTTEEYKEFIASDKALSRRFQIINVKEPNREETISILKKLKTIYEEYHLVKITDEVINKIVDLADKYIYDRKMPDKAIDIMDEVCSRTSVSALKNEDIISINEKLKEIKSLKNDSILNNNFNDAFLYKKTEMILESKKNEFELKKIKKTHKKIMLKDVYKVVEEQSKIPIIRDSISGVSKLNNKLSSAVLGQEEAIDRLVNAYKKKKYGVFSQNKPSSFLFLGATGVGKTLLAKEYGEYLYKDNVIKVDMSEYREPSSVNKMIGSPPGYIGYNDQKNLFEKVKDNPHSMIILDELEKGSKEVINLFLQILDEGKCKNSKGEEINFNNTTIIMTSNLGCSKKSIGFTKKTSNEDINDFFGVEFVNRIENIIRFKSITRDICMKIVNKKLKEIKRIYKIKNINCSFSSNLIDEIVRASEYEKYGARKIDSVIKQKIEVILIDKMLEGLKNIKIDSAICSF